MEVRDLIVEVRDADLNRVGQIVVANLPGLKLVQRFNNVGTWEITLPADDPIADELRAAGAGIIITGDNGVLMSGFTTSAVKEVTPADPVGAWKIQGVDDSVILGERLAYPTPGTADVTDQTTETDARSGLASTVMYEYVDVNIGPSAPAAREIPFLSLAADTGLGSTVFKTARFRVLGEVLSEIGSIDPIGFRVQQSGDLLEFSCYEPTDRTGEIRLDVVNDTLSKSSYGYGVPSVTRAIVGGTGQGTSRTFLEVSDTESLAAETLWGRRIETFVDQNNEADEDVLNQAGLETIAEGGRTGTSVSVLPSSDLTMAYGRDWYLGDRVTVVVGGQEVVATVTEAAITVASDGIRIGATVGDPSGVDFDALITKREQSTPKRLNAVELKEAGGGSSFASTLKHEVKAGEAINKGQAVYVSSANGTNMIVSKASNASEATSSKVMGLLESTLAINAHGYVITEGLLAGLDTSAASNGDPVWLGTSGNLLYGLASKPVAPAHLVFIGIVTRSNSSNGEIFVRPQNGFELDELHDVSIASVAAGDIIRRNTANTLWANVPGATAGLSPAGAVISFAGASAPSGWLLCDGSAVSRTTYASLFTVLSTTYGAGNGSTTFNLPNLKGRVPVGLDSGQTEFDALAEIGGAKTVTLTEAQIPSHTHVLSGSTASDTHNHTIPNRTTVPGGTSGNFFESWSSGGSTSRTHRTSDDSHSHGVGTLVAANTGGGGAHDNLQPYIVMNYIIKT
jgi:microcystin-dependent protein